MTEQENFEGRYLVGIDTGGTYTDAAVLTAHDHRIVATAKALTTRGDLAVGVAEALGKALGGLAPDAARQVALVSISTTLATNAVVEGHGSPIAVVLIGFDAAMAERTGLARALPGTPVERIAGGHDHTGIASGELDFAHLERAVARYASQADAFAVAARFAVRNPAHELAARARIVALTGKPVTLSSELTSALDAPRRALTAALNARLISPISMLIAGVGEAMARLGVKAPLMIVRGDGTLALAEVVALKPIETVLSGPAASVIGAAALSGLSDFILSDMGGTTSDLAVLVGGRPRVAEEGAEIGGWRTMVRAIDVRTIGLGGDSAVETGLDGTLTVGPQRVLPVALLAHRFPEILEHLEGELADTRAGSLAGRFALRPMGGLRSAPASLLSLREAELLGRIEERPQPLRKVAVSSGGQRTLNALARKGLVQICGFTPSDAAHVLGLQDNWSAEAAAKAARLVVRYRDMAEPDQDRIEAFCRDVWGEVVGLSSRAVLEVALGQSLTGDVLADAVCRGGGVVGLGKVKITPTLPVVAVGAPVKVFYGEVGRRLGAEIVIPENFEVANAVGAATGVVAHTVTIEVTDDGGGTFRVHGASGVASFEGAAAALSHAEAQARVEVCAAVFEMGAEAPEIRISTEKQMLPDAVTENDLLHAVVTAEAVGRPQLA
ncbi:MAG TPA: hydantoinase/oxoprolinase family protein, partial [Aestuariivirgaceae bacterium]|nr:hydantoinase/oxoprolinase family protein [Aestuariivirgaceae bacterium]